MNARSDMLADSRIRTAIDEISRLIVARFPDATFSVGLGEDPDGVYLRPVIDLENRWDVIDTYIARLTDLQDDGLPFYVVPVRTPARDAAILRAQSRAHGSVVATSASS
jgi:hypothetical protein